MPIAGLQPKQKLRGLTYPVTRYPGGYWGSSGPVDCAWGDLLSAILTPVGSRIMQREYGSGLHRVLFDPNTVAQGAVVQEIIFTAAEQWCPHVVVHEVGVQQEGRTIQVAVSFSLADDNTEHTRSFSTVNAAALGAQHV